MKALLVLLLLGSTLLNVHALEAQDKASIQAAPPVSGNGNDGTTVVTDAEYVIGPTDVVEVYILKMPELSREYRVNSEGVIEMPFLGPIKAEKTTSRELTAAIVKGLEGEYLVNPQVSIAVRHMNRRYFIQGAVRSPGVFSLEGKPSLLELITIAGGLNPTYGSTAFIMHRLQPVEKDAEAVYDLKKANINALLRGEFKENIRIEPDDIVQIPNADVFFVAGEVKAPGSFPLKEGTTLRQAISLAQNTSMTASPGKAVIFREDGASQKKEIPVDISAIMRGRSPDIAILANDIIVVPNSKAKSAFAPVMNSFGVNIAYGAARAIVP